MWPKLCVLAQSKPSDKFTLVKGMMESHIKPAGEIVAVTGSGANDGPVLRMADVGFTMVSISFQLVYIFQRYTLSNLNSCHWLKNGALLFSNSPRMGLSKQVYSL